MEDEGMDRILGDLEKLQLPNFFDNQHRCKTKVKEHYKLDERHLKKQISAHKDIKAYEERSQQPEEDTSTSLARRANVLSFLHYLSDEMAEAEDENDAVREKQPTSINALVMRIHLCIYNCDSDGAQAALTALQTLAGDDQEREILIAKAEKAFFYTYLVPHLYPRAIALYEEVLSCPAQQSTDENLSRLEELCDQKHSLLYQLELAATYNKLMNQDNIRVCLHVESWPQLRDCHFCFNRIFEILNHIIEHTSQGSENGEEQPRYIARMRGQAWLEFALAYMKYECKIANREHQLPNNMTIDDCYLKAVEICPEDPHILEKYAMHLSVRASNEEDYKNAIKVFDQVLECCPTRHVSLHHKALACQKAWFHASGSRKAVLDNSDKKKGGHNGKKSSRRKKCKDAYSSFSMDLMGSKNSTAATHHGSEQQGSTPASTSSAKTELYNINGVTSNAGKKLIKNGQVTLPEGMPLPKPSPSIPPSKYGSSEKLPRHKVQRYFDELKTLNEKVQDPKNPPKYLLDAKESLCKAVEITQSTSARYLIDLARLHISLRNDREAEKCLQKAKNELNYFNDCDGSYLYEQWGLLQEEIGKNLVKAKNLYRDAIKYSVRARIGSRAAYYRLRDLLSSQLEKEQDEGKKEALRKECGILEITIKEYARAKITFQELLERNQDSVELMWKLVETYEGLGDYFAAVPYIYTIDTYKCSMNEFFEKERSRVLDICLRGALFGDDSEIEDECRSLQALFRLMIHHSKYAPQKSHDPNASLVKESDVLILAANSEGQTVSSLRGLLKDQCGLDIFLATSDNSLEDDIPPGMPLHTATEVAYQQTKGFIVVTDDLDIQMANIVDSILIDKEPTSIGGCRLSLCNGSSEYASKLLLTLPAVTLHQNTTLATAEDRKPYQMRVIREVFTHLGKLDDSVNNNK